MSKVFTVRLPSEQVRSLTTLATFDGVAIAEEIREAIAMLVKTRSQDPNFVRRVKDAYENAGRVLANLERGDELIGALGDPFVSEANAPETANAVEAESFVSSHGPAPLAVAAAGENVWEPTSRALSHSVGGRRAERAKS